MNGRLKFFPATVLLLLLAASCTDQNEYPKTYAFDSFQAGELKAFTQSGEITEQVVINNFIAGVEDYFWQSGHQTDDWKVNIELISEEKAKISGSDTTIFFDIIRKNGIIYFQSSDTLTGYGYITNDRLKYSPLYQLSFPFITGIMSRYIPCYYLVESDGYLRFPMVSYTEKIYGFNGEYSLHGIGNYNNVFNTSYLNKVMNPGNLTDTIVYQDNFINFKEIMK